MANLDITVDGNLTSITPSIPDRIITVRDSDDNLVDMVVGHLLDNYIISPSVSSNNLTVALKGLDGNDPSATNPLHFKVGNTHYFVTAATSYTKNAGTNWHNAGGAELAAQPMDFFLYAIAETGAAAGIKFGHSRIPYALTMGDFVNTTTNEKYIAGNWTNFNATDKVAVIGRFRAQLSAAAGHNWSIASSVVVSRPIYESDWLAWNPIVVGFSVAPTGIYEYTVRGGYFKIRYGDQTAGTSNNTSYSATLPFTAAATADQYGLARIVDNGAALAAAGRARVPLSTNSLSFSTTWAGGAFTNVNGKGAHCSIDIRI